MKKRWKTNEKQMNLQVHFCRTVYKHFYLVRYLAKNANIFYFSATTAVNFAVRGAAKFFSVKAKIYYKGNYG